MKQKQADRPNWQRIIEKRYFQEYIQDECFEGDVSFLFLDKVRQPLMVNYDGEETCIVNDGYCWLMFFPKDDLFSLTVVLNEENKIVQGYFDIIKEMEYSATGIPIIHDLYLDIVCLPDGRLFILDEDELIEALEQGAISLEDFNIAKREMEKVLDTLTSQSNVLIHEIDRYIKRLIKKEYE